MARKSSGYNPKEYNAGFVIMPEGVHQFRIQAAFENLKGRSAQWELELQPADKKYELKDARAYKCWLPEDGCVEAIFDAAEQDPAGVDANVDYTPRQFEGAVVWAEVFHKKSETDDGRELTFANIRRLYPKFSMDASRDNGKPNPHRSSEDTIPSQTGGGTDRGALPF